jgi:cobalamin synthase
MKMLYIQSISHTVFCPKHLFWNLTFGAMAIATTIITETFMTTTIATIFVSAQCLSAALLQSIQGTQGKTIGLALTNKV